MEKLNDLFTNHLVPFVEQTRTTLFDFAQGLSLEQIFLISIIPLLLYISRNLSFIKRKVRETQEAEAKIKDLVSEIKQSESRIHDKIGDLKQSHKDHIKKINIPTPIDTSGKVIEEFTKGLDDLGKEHNKLIENLSREIQEVREDANTDLQFTIQQDLVSTVKEIREKQHLGFNKVSNLQDGTLVVLLDTLKKLESQFSSKIDPIEIEIKKLPQGQNDYTHLFEYVISEIKREMSKLEKNKKGMSDHFTMSQLVDYNKLHNMLIDVTKEQSRDIKDRMKESRDSIIDSIPEPIVIKETKHTEPREFKFPDLQKLNRDLLIQIEEAVSHRLEELNKQILESRNLSTLEIQNTINNVNKIASIVTDKLSQHSVIVPDNNKEVVKSISEIERELLKLKKEISNIGSQIIPAVNKNTNDKFKKASNEELERIEQITRIFNDGIQETKNEVIETRKSIDDFQLKLALVEKNILEKTELIINTIREKSKILLNTISDIDITRKEEQDKLMLMFFENSNFIKQKLNNMSNNPNIEKIILKPLTEKFNLLDSNFEKLLRQISKIQEHGTKFEIDPKHFEEIKSIFQNEIVNQYKEQLVFLELLGSKINELRIGKS